MRSRAAAILAAGLIAAAAPAMAHHGDAGRYEDTLYTVKGTIVEIRLTNPHSIVVFSGPDEQAGGKVVNWQAELNGAQQLMREFGWTKDSPKVGDKITVSGRRVKNGAPYMSMTKRAATIVMTDTGKEIFRAPDITGPPSAAAGRGSEQ